jgi:hypothetical protein
MKQVSNQALQSNFIQRKQTYHNKVHSQRKSYKHKYSLTKSPKAITKQTQKALSFQKQTLQRREGQPDNLAQV